MKKVCSKCKKEKLIENFSNKKSNKDGKNARCKSCTREIVKTHYDNNKKYYIDKSKKAREALKVWYQNFKSKLFCSKCTESRWWVLDFHHRYPNEKEGNLIDVLLSKGKSGFLKELKKCDVLCANCHRDLHHQEKMST